MESAFKRRKKQKNRHSVRRTKNTAKTEIFLFYGHRFNPAKQYFGKHPQQQI
jgi:hypothetical protein